MIKSLEHIKGLWAKLDKNEKLSIYINIPFCKCQCRYCLYKGEPGAGDEEHRKFVYDYLIPSIKRFHDLFDEHEIETIYFGGGTPNAIPIKYIMDICDATACFNRAKNRIIEMNPAYCSVQDVELLTDFGFTLITFGVQSFCKEALNFQQRPYCSEDKITKLGKAIQSLGGKFSLDIMCYLLKYDKSDLEIFKQDVEIAKRTNADFVTIYPELNLILNDEQAANDFVQCVKNVDWSGYWLDDDTTNIEKTHRLITRMVKDKYSEEEFYESILPYYADDFPYATQNIVSFGAGNGKHDVMSYVPGEFYYVEVNLGTNTPIYNMKFEEGEPQ
jgi:hypothetical protein